MAIYQTVVKKATEGEWELRGTESTSIQECPDDLREMVLSDTNLTQRPGRELTSPHVASIDYDLVPAIPSRAGTLTAIMVPSAPRELNGVYEVHSVAILGMSSVLQDENFCMKCCGTCKKQVAAETVSCLDHPEAPVVHRWLAKVSFADDSGSAEAMIYHEALQDNKLLPTEATALTQPQIVALTRKVRSQLWSLRVVYRTNEYKQLNYLEIKKMRPTLTEEGVVSTWSTLPLPEARRGPICPLCRCADVSWDSGLGAAVVDGREVTAVRLWVQVQPSGEEEETAFPDTQSGLRVMRRVKCSADPNDETVYTVSQAGLSSNVQWLLRAADNSSWMLLVSMRGTPAATFTVLGQVNVTAFPPTLLSIYVTTTINKKQGPIVTMVQSDTPLKRKQQIMDEMPSAALEKSS